MAVADATAQTSIAYVQSNFAVPQSPQTVVNVAFTAAQTAGNLNVVVVGWNDATAHVLSVTDTKGNAYVAAVGPTVAANAATQTIYYARNVLAAAANANSVRVTFDRAAPYPDVRIAEYRGLDLGAPLDAAAGASGSSTTSNSGSVTTTSANDLLVGANLVLSNTTGAGAGFTSRVITKPDGDILEDRIVTSVGSYQATAPLSKSAAWVMQIAAFRAATGSVVPDVVVSSQHTGSFTQGQVGAAYTLRASDTGAGPTSGTVTVRDTLPSGLTATALAGTGWTCVVTTLTCTRSDALAAGATYPVITLTVNVASNAPSSVTNAATVSGGGETNTANDTATDVTTIVQLPDLTVSATHAGPFTQGQAGATYTLTVSNVGTGATSGVVSIVDTLPAGLTATSVSGSGWSCVLSTLTCTRSTVLAGGTSYPGITLTVNVAGNAPPSVTNAATISGGGETNTDNDSATDITAIAQLPDLTLTMNRGGPFTQGQSGATYSLIVSNPGSGTTAGVVTVTDSVPVGLTATAAAGTGWNCTLGTPLTCTRPDPLPAGQAFPVIVVTVTVAANAPATVTNTAVVSGGGEANTVNDSASDVTPIVQLPDLTLGATHVGAFTQGQSGAVYTLVISNTGTGSTAGVITVSDSLPAALTATAASGAGWTCTLGTTVTCTWANVIAPGSSAPAIALTMNVAANAPASVTNTATVSGGGESNIVNDGASDVTAIVQVADLTLSATHVGSFVQGQAGAIYTVTPSNNGPGPTTGTVTVVDTLPGGLTATSLAGNGWSCTLASMACSRSDVLSAGASYPAITLTVDVAPNAPPSVINGATVSGGGELFTANDTAGDVTSIVQMPDLMVTSVHGATFTQGQSGAAYTLSVSNTGAGPTTTGVSVTDALPSGLTPTALIGSGWGCTLASLTCTRRDALPAGASYPPIVLTIDVAINAAAVVTNTASVGGGGESNTANDTASDVTAIVQLPDLLLTDTHAAIFAQGQIGAIYTLTVSNVGAGPTTGQVTVVDALPGGLTATGAAGAGWTCTVGMPIMCARADALAAGASYAPLVLTVDVASDAPESVTNTAGVNEDTDPNLANNTVSAVTTIGRPSDLRVTQTHGGSFTQGQRSATYTLTVSNNGTGNTIGVVSLTDVLPQGLTATGLAGAGWTCTLAGLVCTRSDVLADGDTYPAITLTVDVAPTAPPIVTATATVSGGGEINFANDTSADVTAIVQVSDLVVTSVHVGPFMQGQAGASYLLTVTNSGAGATSGAVTVTDILPGGLTPTSLAGPEWSCTLTDLTCVRSDSLAPGAAYPGISLTVDVSPTAPASVTNKSTVSGGGEANTVNDSASDVTSIVLLPDLTVSSSHGSFLQGQIGATYSLVVSNAGAAPTTGTVAVADTLPAGLTATALAGAGWSCTLATLTCTRSDALAGGAGYPAIILTIDVAGNAPASVINTSTVSGDTDLTTANNVAIDVATIGEPPDLTMALSHGGSFSQGQTGATYTLTVANSGASPTMGAVTIADAPPAGLTVTALAGAGWSCSLGSVSCTRSDGLGAGARYPDITLTITVAPNAAPNLTNTAVVSGGGETNTANNSASDLTTIIQLPDLTLSGTHTPPFTQGQQGAVYMLTVSNIGTASTTDPVTVIDTLPAGLTATSLTGAGWTCNLGGLSCTRSDALAAAASYSPITLTVDVAPTAPTAVTNLASVGGGTETTIANNTAADTTPIVPRPDVTVSVTHGGSFTRGQTGATYTLIVSNAGGAPSEAAISVTDTLPAGLTATALAGAGWTCSIAGATCSRNDALAAGANFPTITLTVDVASGAAASVTNLATVSGGSETNTSNDTSADPTSIMSDTQPPSAPTALTASALGSSQINLSWGASIDNVGVTSYVIEGCQGVACSAFAQVATTTATVFSATGLASAASYTYRVWATDAAANPSPYSATASATTGSTVVLPTVAAEAHSATRGTGAAFSRSTLTLNVAGPNRMLMVAWHASADGGAPNSWTVTDNGLAGTLITDTNGYAGGAGNRRFRTYYWVNPPQGTNTIVVSNPYNGTNELAVSAVLLNNVMPTGPLGAVALDVSTAGRTAESETVSTAAGDLVVHVIADALFTRGVLSSGETSVSVANDGTNTAPGNGDASLWISTKPGTAPTTTVSSSGWASSPSPAPRVINGVAIVFHGVVIGPADLTLSKTHVGTFVQGQTGAAYTLTARNVGLGPTTGPVTVTDTLPAGLTATSLTGSGWTCSLAPLACTRSDTLAIGASYPPITLTVTVGAAAGPSVTNVATVAGGGETNTANDTATDVTAIATPDTQPPGAPGPLTATALSGTQVSLSWGPASDNVGVTDYRVERCQGSGCADFVKLGAPTATTYIDTGLSIDTAYSYVVRAEDAAGNLGPYSNTAPVTTLSTIPELVAAYSFSEGAGTSVTDVSGHGNTGTIGSATWTTAGKYGMALVFNGTSAKVSVPDAASLHLATAMTLEAWVNPSTVTSAWRDVVYKGNDNYFLMATTTQSGAPGGGGIFGSANVTAFGTAALPVNVWTHLATTYDGAALRTFVNGSQVSSLARTGTIASSTNPLELGGDSIFGQFFKGVIDEVRIYNVALTPAQIQADMAAPMGGTVPTLSLSRTSADFGNQPTGTTSASQTITLSNTGGSPLSVTAISLSGSNGGDFAQTNGCGSTLAPGANCVISVTFTPLATGARTAAVTITDNALGTPHTVALTGTGAGFSITPRNTVLTPILTQTFATSGTTSGVTWSVDGIAGGSASIGTITPSGVYSPPAIPGVHTVRATTVDLLQSATATVYVTTYPGTFTHHNDAARTGQNLGETVLTPANVRTASFGKLQSYQLDGMAMASPLYAANVTIPGQGVHNVVYVATEHDSVYAFDADGLSAAPLWQRSFLGPGVTTVPAADTGECCDIAPEIGITGTPVIDPVTGTLYVVGKTKEVSGGTTAYVQRLHALDMTTGNEKLGGPVILQASVPGTGNGSSGGAVAFDALRENQRPALLLSNGVVYIAFGSHGDFQPYHGWVLGYDATTLARVMAYNASPNADGGGIWQANGGPAADAAGNIYLITGNGAFDANTGGKDYGDTFVKIAPSGAVLDYFTPWNQATINSNNFDLGAAGPLLLPDQPGSHPHLIVSAGKNNTVYLVDRDAMGHYSAANNDNQIVQSLVNIFPFGTPEPGNYSGAVYFNGTVYFGPIADNIQAFPITNGLLRSSALTRSMDIFAYPGATMAVSASAASNGILWAIQRNGDCGTQVTCGSAAPGVLKAYDAANLGVLLYSSDQAGTRDTLDYAAKFSVPLVANGKVFVGSMSRLTIYGLLP